MKRVIGAAGLAVLAHGFFFAIAPVWPGKRSPDIIIPEAVTLTLAYHRPHKEQIRAKDRAPVKKEEKQRPPLKRKQRKKALKKKRTKKKATPPKEIVHREDASREIEPEQQERGIKDGPSLPEPSLSKVGAREKALPAKGGPASKRPERTALKRAVPKYKANPRPLYPGPARRRGYEGVTLLEVLVDREGRVKDIRIFRSSGYSILDRAAKRSVRKWVFWPARKGDERIKMWVKIPIRFQLK